MPTPLYELQVFLEKPLARVRSAKNGMILWSVVPLCLLIAMTGRFAIVGCLLAIGLVVALPGLMGFPGLEIDEKGIAYKSLTGRSHVAWNSIGPFENDGGEDCGRIRAPVTGTDIKTGGSGFRTIDGKKYMVVEFPAALRTEALARLNAFRERVLGGTMDAEDEAI